MNYFDRILPMVLAVKSGKVKNDFDFNNFGGI